MKILCLCHTCALKHTMDFDPRVGPGAGFSEWIMKHPAGHDTDFFWPERSGKVQMPENAWLNYLSNANVKTAYASAAAVTITLASLASSSTLLAGQQGASVDNTTNLYLDYLIGGKVTTGTTPTASTSILVVATSTMDATNWPDAFTGSNAAITVTSQGIFNNICFTVANLQVDTTTSNRAYPFPQQSLGRLFGGGAFPPVFTVAVFQNTGAALNATAGNHLIEIQGAYLTVV